jgi:tetratricopeptide (TPR) repeat protein
MCEDVLEWTTDVDPTARRRLLLRAGNLALSSGALDQAHRFYEESLDRARELDDPQGVLSAINNLSITAMWQGNFGLADSLLAEADPSEDTAPGSLAILKVTGAERALNTNRLDEVIRIIDEVSSIYDTVGSYTIAEAEVLRGSALLASNHVDDAERSFELALEHAEAADAMEFRALARHGLAVVALERDDLDASRAHLDTALGEARAAGHGRALAQLLATAGRAAGVAGDTDGARSRQVEARQLRIRMGDRHGLAQDLEAEASLLIEADPTRAVQLLGAASTLREQAGGPPWPIEQDRLDNALAALRSTAEFDSLWAAGVAAAGPQSTLATVVATLDQPA